MQRQGQPRHRHDGTSPLPLGMDWSPAPKKWEGRDTVWPHNPRSGWSFCVTIPSWVILSKSPDAEGVVYYRVQVGLQSPEGVTTVRGVLRRFSAFMKLFTELKRTFPKKNLPTAPSKHILRINSNRSLPEERRCSLEEWIVKLLSDIDISRSAPVASFLELEAAARSAFQDENQQILDAKLPVNGMASSQSSSSLSVAVGSSSTTFDYGSDTTYETSDLGTPRGRDNNSEIGLDDLISDQNATTPIQALVKYGISNLDSDLFTGELEGVTKRTMNGKIVSSSSDGDAYNGNPSTSATFSGERVAGLSDQENGKLASHARKLSSESVGSDISSNRGSDLTNAGVASSFGDDSLDFGRGAEVHTTVGSLGNSDLQASNDIKLVLPLDQRNQLNRVLVTMHRRLATAKTDMEDLLARLNQEMAVKEYLTTKVKDLEVELETTNEKNKENLQQAILIERERSTQMQWDMEELRRKFLEMESKLKMEREEKSRTTFTIQEKESLVHELESTKERLLNLQKCHNELQLKSKADIKVLVKEVKSLRNSHSELKQELDQSLKEKTELEKSLQREKQRTDNAKTARAKLLHECENLRNRLQECSINFLAEEDKFIVDPSSISDALDLLATSDNRIGFLLAEAQLLAKHDDNHVPSTSKVYNSNGVEPRTTDEDDIRKMLTDIFIDNAKLRKQVNSVMRCALHTNVESKKDDEETPARKTVFNKLFER